MKNRTKATIFTMLTSIFNSVILVVYNMIYTNLLLNAYGSEVNGLISTITQFVSFFSILEGGMTTAAVVATFDPIRKEEHKLLNSILYTVKRYFYNISLWIALAALICGMIYVQFIESPYSNAKTCALLIISIVTLILNIGGLTKYTVVLQGYNKEYLSVCFSLLAKTITWIISITLILMEYDILLVFGLNGVNILLDILFVWIYEKKNMPHIVFKGEYCKNLIKGTEDVFLQKIANTVFNSTDLVLVSVCVGLAAASVYNLYTLIYKSISLLLTSFVRAPFSSFGQLYAEGDREKLCNALDLYVTMTTLLSTGLLSVTAIMLPPFLRIYTGSITDYNYIYPGLVLLFLGQYFAQTINKPFGLILNVAGEFRLQNKQCVASVFVNLFVSVAFIKWLGIHSIVLGSFVGTAIIVVMNIVQAHKYIIKKPMAHMNFVIICNFLFAVGITMCSWRVVVSPANYLGWMLESVICVVIVGAGVVLLNTIINRAQMKKLFVYLKGMVLK